MVILMVKSKSPKQQSTKACFGTKEWSQNSGICNRCESKEKCGKINTDKE
jgi:hypothetical protein